LRVWNKSHHNSWHLYGHSHGSLPPHGKSVDVGVDCKEITSEYRPLSFKEIKKYMDKRVGEKVDHHGDRD
jgi:calcineurin-like phosphoesterase family protein